MLGCTMTPDIFMDLIPEQSFLSKVWDSCPSNSADEIESATGIRIVYRDRYRCLYSFHTRTILDYLCGRYQGLLEGEAEDLVRSLNSEDRLEAYLARMLLGNDV